MARVSAPHGLGLWLLRCSGESGEVDGRCAIDERGIGVSGAELVVVDALKGGGLWLVLELVVHAGVRHCEYGILLSV